MDLILLNWNRNPLVISSGCFSKLKITIACNERIRNRISNTAIIFFNMTSYKFLKIISKQQSTYICFNSFTTNAYLMNIYLSRCILFCYLGCYSIQFDPKLYLHNLLRLKEHSICKNDEKKDNRLKRQSNIFSFRIRSIVPSFCNLRFKQRTCCWWTIRAP